MFTFLASLLSPVPAHILYPRDKGAPPTPPQSTALFPYSELCPCSATLSMTALLTSLWVSLEESALSVNSTAHVRCCLLRAAVMWTQTSPVALTVFSNYSSMLCVSLPLGSNSRCKPSLAQPSFLENSNLCLLQEERRLNPALSSLPH